MNSLEYELLVQGLQILNDSLGKFEQMKGNVAGQAFSNAVSGLLSFGQHFIEVHKQASV